jgi:hypothetical protein
VATAGYKSRLKLGKQFFLCLEKRVPPFCCEILLLDSITFTAVSLILLYSFFHFDS